LTRVQHSPPVTTLLFDLDGIRARIRRAGLEGLPFTLITSAEIMRSAKPHQRYYAQVLRLLGRRGGACWESSRFFTLIKIRSPGAHSNASPAK
jgi:hypothetical protein